MSWIKAREKRPDDRQEVLIKYPGTHTIAMFESKIDCFLLRDHNRIRVCDLEIEWMPIPPLSED